MRSISLKNLLFVVFSTLLMSIPASFEPGHFAKALFISAFGFSLSISILLLWVTSKHTLLRRIVWVVLFVLFFIEFYVYICFGSRFDPNILTLILQTNAAEASDFVRVYLFSPKSLLIIALAVATGVLPLCLKIKGTIRHRHPKLAGTILGGLFLLGLALPFLPLPFPLGLNTLMQVYNNFHFVTEQHQDIESIEAMLGRIQIKHAPSADEAPAIVLVIGESHNKNHSSIYGYPLPTSPHAEQEQKNGNLIVFHHAMTPTNGTNWAMRYIFSLKECGSEKDDSAQHVLMPAIFKKAGYRVSYLDNQYTRSTSGIWDYSCGYFLNPSTINESCFDYRNHELYQYDDDFVNIYKDKMFTLPKSLVIIHLKGQHFDAALRYPESYAFFSSSDIPRDDLTESQKQQVAIYDNATRYNDMVLSHIMDIYRHHDAVMVYLSDHGEQVYDGPDHHYGREFGGLTDHETLKNVFEIPLLVWCSDTYQKNHPGKYDQIRASASRHICTADLPYFLLDLADIDCNFQKHNRSYIHPHFIQHKVRLD